jgi:hypothetical protein
LTTGKVRRIQRLQTLGMRQGHLPTYNEWVIRMDVNGLYTV